MPGWCRPRIYQGADVSKMEDIRRLATPILAILDNQSLEDCINAIATVMLTLAKSNFDTQEVQEEFVLEIVRITGEGFKASIVLPYEIKGMN